MASLLSIIHNKDVNFMPRRKRVINENGVELIQCHGPLCNGRMLPVSEFNNNYCRSCDVAKHRERRIANYLKYKTDRMHTRIRSGEKTFMGSPIDENIAEIITELQEEQDMKCYYSGVDLVEEFYNINSWSVDRKDFNRGYVKDNVVLSATLVNQIKGSIEATLDKLISEYGPQIGILTFNKIVETLNEVHYLNKK